MMRIYSLNNRQQGFILNAEFMLFVAVLVLGLLVGWVSLRDSFNAELVDTANAIESSITFFYFNDPDRGLGPAFDQAALEFCPPGTEEGLYVDDPLLCLPAGTVQPDGPIGNVATAQ